MTAKFSEFSFEVSTRVVDLEGDSKISQTGEGRGKESSEVSMRAVKLKEDYLQQ